MAVPDNKIKSKAHSHFIDDFVVAHKCIPLQSIVRTPTLSGSSRVVSSCSGVEVVAVVWRVAEQCHFPLHCGRSIFALGCTVLLMPSMQYTKCISPCNIIQWTWYKVYPVLHSFHTKLALQTYLHSASNTLLCFPKCAVASLAVGVHIRRYSNSIRIIEIHTWHTGSLTITTWCVADIRIAMADTHLHTLQYMKYTRKCRTLWGEPEQAATMIAHEQTKLQAEIMHFWMPFMHGPYLKPAISTRHV